MATFHFSQSNHTFVVPENKLLDMTLAFRRELQPFLVKNPVPVPVKIKVPVPVKGRIDLRNAEPVRTVEEAQRIIQTIFDQHKDAIDKEYEIPGVKRLPCIRMAQYRLSPVGELHAFWNIRWATANMKKTAGSCNISQRQIRISKPYAVKVPLEDLRNTVLHEIAHAYVNRTKAIKPHGPEWKKKALEIGCNGQTCHRYQF